MKRTYAYICSQPRSGSTLLSLLLGSHSDITALGEFNLFGEALKNNGLCSCGATLSDCDFWGNIISRILREKEYRKSRKYTHFITHNYNNNYRHTFLHKWLYNLYLKALKHNSNMLLDLSSFIRATYPSDADKAIRNQLRLINEVFDDPEKETSIVLDSTKTTTKLLHLNLKIPDSLKVIVIIRDGRGTLNSYLKSGEEGIEELIRSWKYHIKKQQSELKIIPDDIKMIIKYEELCADTHNVLNNICEFLKVPYEEKMIEMKGPRHMLGGNTSTFTKKTINFDEEWKENLGVDQLRLFDDIAGEVNRDLGYF